jgi:Tfp pilus assembly protein PilN
MIEINLIQQKKPFRLPVVLGIDLAAINIKAVIFVFVLYKVSYGYLAAEWKQQYKSEEIQVKKLQKQLQNLKKETRGNESIKAMLDAFDKQVDNLKQRTSQVEKVINMKNNPKMLLERLARDVPKDVWFESVKLLADSKISINGRSASYKSIGNFITSANDSAFFGKTLGLISSDTKTEVLDGQQVRVENFIVEGKIIDYGRF